MAFTQKNLRTIEAINTYGALLVFPIKNNPFPKSIWSVLYPRSEMRWEWDQGGDTRVHDLWHMREKLSQSGKVVYGKFFKGRATFYSRAVFKNILALSPLTQNSFKIKNRHSAELLNLLEDSSPLSTKQIKKALDLKGRDLESTYNKALKELWQLRAIVGWGEKDEGAFPSLQIGATSLLFEDLWRESKNISHQEAIRFLEQLPVGAAIQKAPTP